MCQTGERIKLCTCGDVDTKGGEYWELYLKKNGSRVYMIGSFEPGALEVSPEPKLETRIKDSISADLNSGNCFDFCYEPSEGDELKIVALGTELWFYYSYGLDDSYSSLRWRVTDTEMSEMPVGPSQRGPIR